MSEVTIANDPFRLVPPCRREGVFLCSPFRMIVVPQTHDATCLGVDIASVVIAAVRNKHEKGKIIRVGILPTNCPPPICEPAGIERLTSPPLRSRSKGSSTFRRADQRRDRVFASR